MIDIHGDLWDYPDDVTAITTNGYVTAKGACVMGRGCALQAKMRYPGIELNLGALVGLHGNRCFHLRKGLLLAGSDRTLPRTILTFPVKHHWRQAADLRLIAKSCGEAMEMADKFGWEKIVLPRPGCGNGGLTYEWDVRPKIESLLDDRFHIITYA